MITKASNQFINKAQISKIKGFLKSYFYEKEKPQNQPEGPPKQEDEGECFAPFASDTHQLALLR